MDIPGGESCLSAAPLVEEAIKEVNMTRRTITIIAALLSPITCSTGLAYVYGGSNLTFNGHPKFSPYVYPSRPYSKDQWAWDNYRNDVERYRREAQEYIENAENDIERTQIAIKNAINDANRVVNEYNAAVRGY